MNTNKGVKIRQLKERQELAASNQDLLNCVGTFMAAATDLDASLQLPRKMTQGGRELQPSASYIILDCAHVASLASLTAC